jgi:AAA15 family ATPase/GTPase
MKLREVEIINYRSIREVRVNFDPSCRVLVGINESGKSNVLKALALLQPELKPIKKDDVRESLEEEDEIADAHVRYYMRLEKAETDRLFASLDEKIIALETDPLIVIQGKKQSTLSQFCKTCDDARYYVDLLNESKEFRAVALSTNLSLVGSWKKPSKDCPADFNISIQDKSVPLAGFRLIEASLDLQIPLEYLTDADFSDFADLVYDSVRVIAESAAIRVISWEYDEHNLLPSEISMNSFAAAPESCAPLKNMFALAGVDDIPAEIERVKTLSNNQAQNFFNRIAAKTTQQFQTVWKEYASVTFTLRLDADKIVPGIKEHNSFDLSKRSDGFKRFVTFLLMISLNVANDKLTNTLLLIDEPDYGLHPTGSRYLRDELIRISAKNYVVYSTHSIFMIDAGNIERHYIVKKTKEATSVETAKESNVADEEVLYNALGFSLFEVLKEKNIIFEGWRDKRLFQIALTKTPTATKKAFKDVGICHAKGAKHIKTITPMIELAKRGCLILSDSDQPAKDQQKIFNKEKGFGEWKVYQEIDAALTAVTGEDFVKKTFLITQLSSVTKSSGLPEYPKDTLPGSNRLKAIEAWLKQNGMNDEQAKDTIGDLKTVVFEKLSPKDIEDDYQRFLDGIAPLVANE